MKNDDIIIYNNRAASRPLPLNFTTLTTIQGPTFSFWELDLLTLNGKIPKPTVSTDLTEIAQVIY